MKILKFDKNSPEWLEYKRAKLGGSRSKSAKPLTRGTDRTPALLWDIVAESLSRPGQEASRERGHDNEASGVDTLSQAIGLELDDNPGVWVSDIDESIIVTPDGAQPGDKPKYSAEIKVLGGGKHFKYLYKFRHHNGNAIDAVPDETGAYFKDQCIKYFTANENLEEHYFALYNPDCIYKEHELAYVKIQRYEVIDLVLDQIKTETQLLGQARFIVDELAGDKF
jgi:hypothetical protein